MPSPVDLDLLRRVFAATPFMADLGVQASGFADGVVTTTLELAPRHLQHTGQVHAGVMIAMADHSMGASAQAAAGEGQWIVTAEIHSSLLRAAKGERLVCEARVVKPGRQLTFTEADVWCESAGVRAHVLRCSATMAVTPSVTPSVAARR